MAEGAYHPSFRGDSPVAADNTIMKDRRELALVAVERTRMPMVITDPTREDNPIVLANEAFLELTGYSAGQVIGRNCRFLQGPDTDPAEVDRIRRGLAADDDHVSAELLNYRRDGSPFWNQLEISAVRDDRGLTIYHFGSQKDINARRRAQAMEVNERLLLKEVDHRSLNALALVQSIVRLTRSDTAQGFAQAVAGRVDALAHAHQLLSESGWRGASLHRVLAREGVTSKPIAFEGPAVSLPPRLVQPIALIFHELLANAEQHGTLERPQGRVNLGWKACPEVLRIRWIEQSESDAGERRSAGFGFNLIRAVVERQLEGRVEIDWSSSGVEVEMALPWSAAEFAAQ